MPRSTPVSAMAFDEEDDVFDRPLPNAFDHCRHLSSAANFSPPKKGPQAQQGSSVTSGSTAAASPSGDEKMADYRATSKMRGGNKMIRTSLRPKPYTKLGKLDDPFWHLVANVVRQVQDIGRLVNRDASCGGEFRRRRAA